MNRGAKTACLCLPFLLVGCAQTYTWVKPGASNSEFYRAKSYCEALATGATPMDFSNQGSSTTYYSGTVTSSSGNYGSYSGTSTTYNTGTSQAMANLGKSIKRQNLFNDCMRGQGWRPQQEVSASMTSNRSSWDEWSPSHPNAIVTKDRIEVLSKPTLASETLGLIDGGKQVKVLKRASGGWLLIHFDELQGYAHEKWLAPVN